MVLLAACVAVRGWAQSPVTAPSLRLELVAPAAVRVGEVVPVTIRITNTTSAPLAAYFVGREIAFDIVVRRPDSSVVWHRLAGRAVQTILQIRTLAAGETLELRHTWRQRDSAGAAVPAGSYTVQGVVPGGEREPLRTAVRTLEIRP